MPLEPKKTPKTLTFKEKLEAAAKVYQLRGLPKPTAEELEAAKVRKEEKTLGSAVRG